MSATVSIREVNQHTSAVFQRVENGDDLVVTKAGRPLARVIPFRPRDRYEQLVAEGRVIPAEAGSLPPLRPVTTPHDVDELIAWERADAS